MIFTLVKKACRNKRQAVLSNAEVTIPLSTSGVLGGSSCTLVLAGTFNPIP
jgi:hypothetical protein